MRTRKGRYSPVDCRQILRRLVWLHGLAWVTTLLAQAPASAQLDQTCTVSALNRTALVDAGGVWVLPNVPATIGEVRVRATCIDDGVTRSGQSDFFTVPTDGVIEVADIVFDNPEAVPATLSLSAPDTTLTIAGQTTQLAAIATYPDSSTADVTAAAAGTSYTISNPVIATLGGDGLITAVASGTVLVSAANEGALGLLTVRVVLSGDSDSDGLPDDFELANGLDPNDPADAFADADGDGLTHLEEFQAGTDLFDPDTDGDGLLDGDELAAGTDPLLFDTDGDQVSDGLEIAAGSDPLDPSSVDLAPILSALAAEPASFTLVFNTVLGEASKRLEVSATLVDGTVIDVTGGPYGTGYASSDLTVASFGAEPGRVFAGQDGTATVSASIGAFSSAVEVTVRTFSPVALSFLRIPGFANGVAVEGDYAYVAAGSRGLFVVDVSDLEAPFIAGSIQTPGIANGVEIEGAYAYVAAATSDREGLLIVDVSEPSQPSLAAAVDIDAFANDLAVAEGLAYVAAANRLVIVDVSDPAQPAVTSSISLPGNVRGVGVSGSLVVVAAGSAGVHVIDVSDPMSPFLAGTTHTRPGAESRAAGVAVRERLAYVADGADGSLGGLRIVDFREPTNPVVVGTSGDRFGLTGVALDRGFALAADYFFVNAVPIFSVAGPAPVFAAALDFSGAPSFRDDNGTDVDVRDGVVFLTGDQAIRGNGQYGDGGLHIGRYLDSAGIDGGDPTVRVSEPLDGGTVFERRPVTVRAEASDDDRVEVVEFLIDGEIAHRDFTAPYEHLFLAPAQASSLTLGARALDRGGNEGLAEEVTLEVLADDAPTVSFLSPLAGSAVTEGTSLPVALQATDDFAVSSVELFVDGASQGALNAPPYRYEVPVPLDAAQLTLSAQALDDVGQPASAGPLPVAVEEDLAPFVTILEPVAGSGVTAGGRLRVTVGAADDLGVTLTRLEAGPLAVGEDAMPPYEFELDVPIGGSELTLRAEAVDTLDQVGVSAQVTLTIVPDPLTTVFGRVLDTSGQPVLGAEVEAATGEVASSDAAGYFEIPGVVTAQGDVVVLASAVIGGESVFGESEPATPQPGGITDVGDIVLGVLPTCPCLSLDFWPMGGDTWIVLALGLSPIDFCSDDGATITVSNTDDLNFLTDEAAVFRGDDSTSSCSYVEQGLDGNDTETVSVSRREAQACAAVLLAAAQSQGQCL